MARSTVGILDAVVAVQLMETSTSTSALCPSQSPLHTDFPEDPDTECTETFGEDLTAISVGLCSCCVKFPWT